MRIPRYRCELVRESTTDYPARQIGSINSTQRAREATKKLMPHLSRSPVEHFEVITLSTKLKPIGVHHITKGTLDASLVHPREVFRAAILDNAASVLLVHNHPSGDTTPSRQDREVTERLKNSGKILGIDVLDHIIVGFDEETGEITAESLAESS